jgi:hypothetical protein
MLNNDREFKSLANVLCLEIYKTGEVERMLKAPIKAFKRKALDPLDP